MHYNRNRLNVLLLYFNLNNYVMYSIQEAKLVRKEQIFITTIYVKTDISI